MLRIAFKEWAAVCRALALGQQTIILRKGGIAEQGGTFRPEHDRFWLYPTHFHEQQQKGLKPDALHLLEGVAKDRAPEGEVRISAFCDVTEVWFVDNLDSALALEGLHVWSPGTVLQRFEYRTPGLYVLAARVRLLFAPIDVAERPEYAGCKTWVELDRELSTDGAVDVLSQAEFDARVEKIRTELT